MFKKCHYIGSARSRSAKLRTYPFKKSCAISRLWLCGIRRLKKKISFESLQQDFQNSKLSAAVWCIWLLVIRPREFLNNCKYFKYVSFVTYQCLLLQNQVLCQVSYLHLVLVTFLESSTELFLLICWTDIRSTFRNVLDDADNVCPNEYSLKLEFIMSCGIPLRLRFFLVLRYRHPP